MSRAVHPIETESYRLLREAVDLSHMPALSRAVAERIVHTTGDVDWAGDLLLDEAALAQGCAALRAGAPLVVDVRMVAAGVTSRPSLCGLDLLPAIAPAAALEMPPGLTRSAAGLRLAVEQVGPGAVYAIGNAPTALFELLALDARPALVVGLPVGWVGAVESKEALAASGLPALANRSRKGGSAVAAAAVNALLYSEDVT
jgi:precorrin-8X/cobalt-precorrin-8 methylmutase